jgi:hypothetical protein
LGKIVAACARASLIRRTITGSKVAQHFPISVGSSELVGRARGQQKARSKKHALWEPLRGRNPSTRLKNLARLTEWPQAEIETKMKAGGQSVMTK